MSEAKQIPEIFQCVVCGQNFKGQRVRFGVEGMDCWLTYTPSACPACVEEVSRKEAAAAEAQRRQEREEKWARLCPAEYRLTSESSGETNLEQLRHNVPRLEELIAWADGDRKRGLLLRGPPGASKTRVMYRIARRLWENGVGFRIVTPVLLEAECQEARNSHQKEWMQGLIRVPVLFLHRLNKFHWLPTTQEAVVEVIQARVSQHKPVVVMTTETGDSLERQLPYLGETLARCLREFCDQVEMGE